MIAWPGMKEKKKQPRNTSKTKQTNTKNTSYWMDDNACDYMTCDYVQAIKQKLHMRSRLTEEPPVTDVQEEQDKAKMLLGAKLLVCIQVHVFVWVYGRNGEDRGTESEAPEIPSRR